MEDTRSWYQTPIEEIFEALETSNRGLSTSQAEKRLEEHGYNELKAEKRSPIIRFLSQFNNPLLYVLIGAAILTAVLGHYIDTYVIVGVVIATVIIGFVQEGKAEASLEALKSMMVPQCLVLRDGEKRTVPARELVPGDVVLIESGDRLPADLRLFLVRQFYVDEAALTGESKPVEKHTNPLPKPNLPPGDQRSMAFSGSFVTRGRAEGVVVATGKHSQMGEIAAMMTETKRIVPPIVRKIHDFTKFILIACLAFALIILALGILLGYELGYMLLATAAILVALIPEGLPAAIITAFAVGSMAMARRHALIRRLPAAETLGATTVICSDKTGTLTLNEMTVVRIYTGERLYHLTGAGYEPQGDFFYKEELYNPKEDEALLKTLTAGFLCNNAELIRDEKDYYGIRGDPTEGALKVSAAKAEIMTEIPPLDEVPFESENEYMATLHTGDGENVIYVKGSPEAVLKMCSNRFTGTHAEPLDADSISKEAQDMASDALRVLAMAYKSVPKDKGSLDTSDMKELTFLGLQGMIDPPREEAIDAVKKSRRAGVRSIMITGDHMITARAVAKQLGIADDEAEVLTGEQVSAMSDQDLYQAVERVSVYARTSPAHKYRIAKQLQKRGHIVAMTGDGVNDAPALKAADIGVAMGTGTEVSREAADMVLTDDNFASIVAAVEEGRHIYNNIMKVILYLLPTNGGQGLVLISAILLSPWILVFAERLPLEPVMALWVNLVVAIGFGLPLIWESKERGLLDRPPRNPEEKLYNPLFLRRVGLVSLLSATAAAAMFLLFVDRAGSSEESLSQAQTVAFTTLIFVQFFYLFTARTIHGSVLTINPFSNRLLILGAAITVGLQVLIVYSEPLFGVSPFRTVPFPVIWWLPIIGVSLAGLMIVEIEKLIERRMRKDR